MYTHELAYEALDLLEDNRDFFTINSEKLHSLREQLGGIVSEDILTHLMDDNGAYWRQGPTWIPHANIVLNVFSGFHQGWIQKALAMEVNGTYVDSILHQIQEIRKLTPPGMGDILEAYELQLIGLEELPRNFESGKTQVVAGANKLRAASLPKAPKQLCLRCGEESDPGRLCSSCGAKLPDWVQSGVHPCIDILEGASVESVGPLVREIVEAVDRVERRQLSAQHFETLLHRSYQQVERMMALIKRESVNPRDYTLAPLIEGVDSLLSGFERLGYYLEDGSPTHLLVGRQQTLAASTSIETERERLREHLESI